MSDEPSEPSAEQQEGDAGFHEAMARFRAALPYEERPGARFWGPLGEFMLTFNQFEQGMNMLIHRLANSGGEEADILTLAHVQSVDTKIRLVRQMGVRRFPQFTGDISSFYTKARRLNFYRNVLVHGQWRSLGFSGSMNETEVHVNTHASVLYFDSSADEHVGKFVIHHIEPDGISKKTKDILGLQVLTKGLLIKMLPPLSV